jgi:long-chain acyl-CoA synthetase
MNPLLAALARRAPDDIVLQDADRSLTAEQLRLAVENLRTSLSQAGIDRAGLLAANSAAWVSVDLASQLADICLLPLPTFFADSQLQHSVNSVGLDAVVTDDPERVIDLLGADRVRGESDFGYGLTLLRITGSTHATLPRQTRKITFTSGSTGTPRGVCLGIEQQLRVAEGLNQALRLSAPRHLCLLPLSTLLENVGGVYYPLLAGGTVIVPPEQETGFSGTTGLNLIEMLHALERYRPTSIILLPQMLVGLVAALEEGWRAPDELKFAAVGGAKVSAELLQCARDLGLPVYEGYGLSETASVACLNLPGSERIGSAGRPLPHAEVRIDSGEVMISGNGFLGYVDDPGSWGMKEISTGDLGELDADGYLHLRGRRKNLLISSLGRNISPEWIESELLSYPAIGQCIVVGDERPYCAALISPAAPDTDDEEIQALLDEANQKLPDYARIQRWHRLEKTLSPADGLFTENGRPRRTAIVRSFGPVIDSLYSDTTGFDPTRSINQ